MATSRHASGGAATLRARIERGEFIAAPGVFDLISARIADRSGCAALYMTGYGTVASHLGLPDAGLATFTEMVERVGRIADAVEAPLIADADTGYGGLLNVDHTVRGYERAGAAAVQIEDQEIPKKCGHTPGRRVIALEDMVAKVRVAAAARESAELLIIARTDARTHYGLDEAIRRGRAYAEAGADIVFVEAPESVAEMERICASIDRPLVANIVDGGNTPVLPAEELQRIGYRLAIYPASGFLAAAATLRSVYGHIAERGSSVGLDTPLYDFGEFSRLMGFERVWAFERRWAAARSEDPEP